MMTLAEQAQLPVTDPLPVRSREPVAVIDCAPAMRQLLRPGVALAIWQRSLEGPLRGELSGLALDRVEDILLTGSVDALDGALARAMDEAGYPPAPRLRDDIVLLARAHAAVIGESEVCIRLEVVETDACRRFHADYVTARTITTYIGQGTQWVESECAENAGAPGGAPIRPIDTGSVAMFKGRLWQEVPSILHRSPPIGGPGEQRLVLVVDPAPANDSVSFSSGAQNP